MFQNFDAPIAPVRGSHRLNLLRDWMTQNQVTAVLVPHNDEQNNEYLSADKERLAWLTGFTGSAGSAIVTHEQAVLFVDGRYTLQAAEQADTDHWSIESLVDLPPHRWLEKHTQAGDRFGFDPWLHTAAQVKLLNAAAGKAGVELQELPENPIDAVWDDQPAPPLEPTRIHDHSFAGRLTSDKLADIQSQVRELGADHVLLTDPSSICWLFNIRGSDVAHTPITLAHALVPAEGDPILFIDQRKLDMETKAFLTQVSDMVAPSEMAETIEQHARQAKILIDANLSPVAFNNLVITAGGSVIEGKDPVSLARAVKNDVELAGSRTAHLRDGAAMTSFLAWLDHQEPGTVDEIGAAQKLEQFRAEMAGNMPLRDISFDTISGSGPNGAIVHYRVNQDTNRTLQNGELYLSDSGGQYDDGTTDITRTMAIGSLNGDGSGGSGGGADERKAYTLVLKGHIAIARARFPKGTRGVDLDPLARMHLWQHGMDYAHGTGHGVGSYLSVHEGPQNISKRGMQELLPGMILSNEPGYYRTGKFGIRIENLVIVQEAAEIDGGDQPMLGFETITLAPMDHRLIDPDLLSDEELNWLNAYHDRVRHEIAPLIDGEMVDWLHQATQPIVRASTGGST